MHYYVPSFKIPADIFTSLDEPLGESNTERRVKNQLVFQKKIPNNIFTVRLESFTSRVKI